MFSMQLDSALARFFNGLGSILEARAMRKGIDPTWNR